MRTSITLLLCFITVSLYGGKQIGFSVLNLSHLLERSGQCPGTSVYLRDGRSFCAAEEFLSISKRIQSCTQEL